MDQTSDMKRMIEAYADGELSPDERVLVAERLAADPSAMRQVVQVEKLRAACRRVMTRQCPKCPAELRRRLQESAIHEPMRSTAAALPVGEGPVRRAADHGGWRISFGQWLPLAAAAMFFLAAVVALQIGSNRPSLGDGAILPVSQVEQFQWRHTRCSRQIDDLARSEQLARPIEQVPAAIADLLGQAPVAVLDLSALGYRFEGAGPCNIPGHKAVHLIYRADEQTGRQDTLSLWIQPDEQQLNIAPETLHQITGDQAAHPMLVWRHGGMIYYLVGDSDQGVRDAAQTLARRD